MNTVNAVRKLEKFADNNKVNNNGNRYWAEITGTKGTEIVGFHSQAFMDETPTITCIYTKKKGDVSDSMTDYFVENFHSNLSQAIGFACQWVGKIN